MNAISEPTSARSAPCAAASLPWPQQLRRPQLSGLYVITEEAGLTTGPITGPADRKLHDPLARHEQISRAAIAGGARVIQLRDKSTPLPQLHTIALRLRHLTREAGVLFFVNDRPDLALACDADGVHLGPDDLPIQAARRVLGPHRLIGISCGTPEEAQQAARQGADYIGAGAIFSTTTKHDAGAPIGLDTLRAIATSTPLPVAAIAGINADNIGLVARNGARMACVVSAVTRAGDAAQMVQATRELVKRFHAELPESER